MGKSIGGDIGKVVGMIPGVKIVEDILGLNKEAPQIQGTQLQNADERKKQIDEGMKRVLSPESTQFLNPQLGAIGALQGLATQQQNAPSVVNQQVQNAQTQNLENQMAMAASQRGAVNPALALRQQQQGIAQGNQQILQQSLPAALQEQQQQIQNQIAIQNQIGQLSAQGRGQDQSQLQMTNQLALQYMQLGLTQDQAIMQAQMDLQKTNAGLRQSKSAQDQAMIGGLLQTGGAIAGMAVGGPAGAAVGSQIGGQVGTQVVKG